MTNKFKALFDAKKGQGREQAQGPPRRGRPQGKHSDPDYRQVTAYIRRDTHQRVKLALLEEGKDREFSELLEELLSNWLKARK